MRTSCILLLGLLVGLISTPTFSEPRRGDGGRNWDRGHHSQRGPQIDPGTVFWGGVLGGLLGNLWEQQANKDAIAAEEARTARENWLTSCSIRYKSFDPVSGTYLGYDGVRHPCT